MGREHYTPEQQAYYRDYLQSPEWKERRRTRIEQAGGQCEFVLTEWGPTARIEQRCPRRRHICVHHQTYVRLGHEEDGDLSVLCYFHHMAEHLLWQRCEVCGGPALDDDASAVKWLEITLGCRGIDIDTGPENWIKLPTKESLLAEVPPRCSMCQPLDFVR